jgi:hypothetical protein
LKPLGLIRGFYGGDSPIPALCGANEDAPYSRSIDPDLTVIINAYGKPEYLPLIWEAIQYQSRRPIETWIIQNDPPMNDPAPLEFFNHLSDETRLIESDINFGCWQRFFLAAMYVKTKYVAIFDDDTMPGYEAMATVLGEMEKTPGIYGGVGVTFKQVRWAAWNYGLGWQSGCNETTQVDYVGHLWVMETAWMRELFKHVPPMLFDSKRPAREWGEDMYVSFVAQKLGIPTFVYPHGSKPNPRYSSLQGHQMNQHRNAMFLGNSAQNGEVYFNHFIANGWRLLCNRGAR